MLAKNRTSRADTRTVFQFSPERFKLSIPIFLRFRKFPVIVSFVQLHGFVHSYPVIAATRGRPELASCQRTGSAATLAEHFSHSDAICCGGRNEAPNN